MHITGLEASGLKGLSFAHTLQRCVLITGPNFSGKSARLEAIRWTLTNRIPDLDKTNQALWDLSGSAIMRANLTFDNGDHAIRELRKEGESVKSGTLQLPGWLEGKPMPMLNPEEYFGLTDSERIQYVFGMMQMPDTFTVDGIIADLRNLSLAENTEQTEKAKNDIIGIVKFKLDEGVGEPSLSIASALTELTREKGTLKTEFSIWNRRAKDTQGTLRVLSELKTRAGEAPAETIQGVSAEMQRVASELAAANQAAGALTQQQMAANRVALRRTQIDDELAQVPVDFESPEPLTLKLAEIDSKLKKAPVVEQKSLLALAELHDDAERAVADAEASRNSLNQDLDAVVESLVALKTQTQCPHCGSKGKDWKKTLQAGIEKSRDEIASKIAVLDTQVKALTAKSKKAKLYYTKAKTAYDARQTLETERAGHQRSLEAINARAAGATARRQALQEEGHSLRDTNPPTDAELSESAAKVLKLKEEHQALSERHSALLKLQQDLIRAGEAAEEHRIAAAKVAVIKAVGAVLKEKQASMINVVFRDLMKTANYFTRDIMEHELVFQEGRIGYVKQGRFVSHSTFSGTERALTYIAVTAALMLKSPLRLVLLDEFDIDADVFPKVLNRLNGAVSEGYIDQVIVAHTFAPSSSDFAAKQWQQIPLTKAE